LISKSDVKYIQSLSHKKFREEEGVFIVEGVKMVNELIAEFPSQIIHIYALQNWVDQHPELASLNRPYSIISEQELGRISHLTTANEVLCLVSIPKLQEDISKPSGITLVLDQIQDPGNLGTIIRTCDWFGIHHIICSTDTVDAYNPKTVQSAKGSLLRVKIAYTELSTFFSAIKEVPVYAAVLGGESIQEVKFRKPAVLIIGNEANGISAEVLSYATEKIAIPKLGKAESLNAAIASAIIISAMQLKSI
jgi:TrmH family RNA methyltransferase